MELTAEQRADLAIALATVITAVFAVALSLAIAWGRKLLKSLAARTGRPEIAQLGDQLDRLITSALMYVEEQVQKYAKGLITNGPRTPQQKLQLAEDFARRIDPETMGTIDSEQFVLLAEAKLPSIRPLLSSPPIMASVPPRQSIPTPGASPVRATFTLPRASKVPTSLLLQDEDPPTNPGSKPR